MEPEELKQILADYVATAKNPKYKGDFNVINSKFPEFKNYDKQVLADYVATANNPKYKGNFDLINSKFPEFFDVKKKAVSKPITPVSRTGGYGSQFGSQTFQPTKAYVPAPLIGQGAKSYKAPSQKKAQPKPETSYGQNFEAMFASGVDQLGRMVSSIPSGLLDLSIQAFGTPALKASMDADMLGKLAEKELGVKEAYNPFSPKNYLANLYKERGETAQAKVNLKYGGSITEAIKNKDYTEAGKLLSLNVSQALPVMVGLVASRGAGAGEAASLIGLGLGTQATTYEDLKQQYPNIDKNTLLTNSILTGLGESGSELLGTSLLYNQGRKLLAKGATKEAEDLVKGGVKSYLDNAFKKSFVGSAVIADASGEMTNQLWKNFVDKETVDPNRKLLDGVLDAGIVSLGMTGPVAGGIKLADRVLNPTNKKTIEENSNKIKEINKELDNPEVNTTTKALLLNQVSDLTEKLNDAIDEDSNIYNSLDEVQKETVNKISDEIEGLTESLQSSNISEPTKELLKGQIATLNTQLQNAIQKQSTASQVPPVIEGGQNLQEGGKGVGQSIQGTEASQAIIPQEKPELKDVKSTSDFIRSNDLSSDISQKVDQFFIAKEGKDINDTISEEYHRAKLDGSNPELVKVIEESAPEVSVQETVTQAPQAIGKEEVKPSMSTAELNKIPRGETFQERLAPEYYESLKKDIKENGIKEPIVLRYYYKGNAIRLLEGHHRLKIANELGIKNIPVRVIVVWDKSIKDYNANQDIANQKIYNPKKQLNIDQYRKRNYFPSEVKLEELGFENTANLQKATKAPQEFVSEEVSRLREQEQAEYAAMKNPNDAVKRKAIYDRYNKLITPAIREAKKEAKPEVIEVDKIELPDLKDDSLDNFVEDLTNISDLEANMKRTSSKSRKAKLKEKIDQESANIDMTSPEAIIAKGVNDSYESIKKQLKEKGLLKTKC